MPTRGAKLFQSAATTSAPSQPSLATGTRAGLTHARAVFHKRNSSPPAVGACANEDRIGAGSSLGAMRRGTLNLVMLCIVSSGSWVISHREATVSAGLGVILCVASA